LYCLHFFVHQKKKLEHLDRMSQTVCSVTHNNIYKCLHVQVPHVARNTRTNLYVHVNNTGIH
jgi:hypothetical protein